MHNRKIQFSPKSVKIEEFVSGTMLVLAPIAQNKEIKLNWKVNSDITAKLDTNMIGSVLQNMVTNAIKFTGRGGEVNVLVFSDAVNLNFEISDTGVGMSDEQCERLFRLDKTSSTRGTDEEAGTGLGLIISKEFVEMHRGKIWAESRKGRGSKFSFTVPV
jgi:signal transduction histidine kinase